MDEVAIAIQEDIKMPGCTAVSFYILLYLMACTHAGPFTTSPQGRTTFTIKFVQTVIAPVVTAVLFLLILIVGIVVSVKCIRTSLRHKKQARHTQQPKVVASLDSLERTSVFNIYPSNPVLGIQLLN